MAVGRGDIELAGVVKSYDGVTTVVDGINLQDSRRRLLLLSGAVRLRQDDDPAHDRRPRGSDRVARY